MSLVHRNFAIIACAAVMMLLIEAPLIAFTILSKNSYQGINIAHFGTDEHFYLTRGNEILKGNALGNPGIREGKNENSDYFFTINERVLVGPWSFLGFADKINIVTLYNFYNAIGIFFLILLIYSFILELKPDKSLAIASAIFVVGGYSIIYNKILFYNDFNIYGRSLIPYISSLVFFGYLLLLAKALKSGSKRTGFWSGLLFGLTFYTYFFTWTFALALNSSLFLIFLMKKDWPRVKQILAVSAIGILAGLYNLVRLILFVFSSAGQKFVYFSWSLRGHQPIFSNLGFIVLIFFLWFFYKNRKDENTPVIFAFVASSWLALNQQIITGRVVQQNHYYWYFIVPLFIISVLYMLWFFLENTRFKIAVAVLLIFLAFLNTAVGQYRSALVTWQNKLHEQNYKPIIDFLNKDKKPGVILAADDALEYLFPIYTRHDLFWVSGAELNDNPIQRYKDTLFLYIYLNKGSRNDFSSYIDKLMRGGAEPSFYRRLYENLEGYLSGFDYYEYKKLAANGDPIILEKRKKIIGDFSKEYNEVMRNKSGAENILRKYGVNYIVWNADKNPEWDLSFVPELQELVKQNSIYLYKINYLEKNN